MVNATAPKTFFCCYTNGDITIKIYSHPTTCLPHIPRPVSFLNSKFRKIVTRQPFVAKGSNIFCIDILVIGYQEKIYLGLWLSSGRSYNFGQGNSKIYFSPFVCISKPLYFLNAYTSDRVSRKNILGSLAANLAKWNFSILDFKNSLLAKGYKFDETNFAIIFDTHRGHRKNKISKFERH